jgi:lysophospholipase L1-like esterase
VTERRGKLLRGLKIGIMSMIPAVVLLGCSEWYATMALQRRVAIEDDGAGKRYVMRIGKLPWSRVTVTPLNSAGFPDVEFATIGAKHDCMHAVFLGDSFAFGDGVDRDSSFVSLVRAWAKDRRASGCVRVFNLGARGTTIDKQSSSLHAHLDALQPDIVIVAQYQNDLTDLTHSESEIAQRGAAATSENWREVRHRFRTWNLNLVRFATYHLFAGAIQRSIHYDVLKHWSVLADSAKAPLARELMANYRRHFVRLKDDLGGRGIALGVVILPSKLDLLAGRYPEGAFFESLARETGVPYLSIYPILDRNRDPSPFLTYDGHLNEGGNRLVAEAVYEWLFGGQTPFPRLKAPGSGAQAAADAPQDLKD